MNMPFCDHCQIANKCVQDLVWFQEATGNKRIPPEDFCQQQYAAFGVPFNDFYRQFLIKEADNPYSVVSVYPELKAALDVDQEGA